MNIAFDRIAFAASQSLHQIVFALRRSIGRPIIRSSDRVARLRFEAEPLERRQLLSSAYAITDLGAGEATAINASGQVVGEVITSEGYENAFLYSNGSIRNLGTLPNLDSSNATGINDRGEVVGYAYQKDIYSDFEPYAFVDDNGVMTALAFRTLIPSCTLMPPASTITGRS